jgi:hypothetical protein
VSTQINVTVDSGGLGARVKQQQNAARQAQLERERTQRVEIEGRTQRDAKRAAEGRTPDGQPLYGTLSKTPEIDRRPAASRVTVALSAFALQWRGDVTYQPQTVWEDVLFPEVINASELSTVTYSGGHLTDANNFQIAAGSSVVNIPQQTRYTEWQTVPKLCITSCGPNNWIYDGCWAETITVGFTSGVPGASLSNPVYLTKEFIQAPPAISPVGPISHSATGEYLAVKPDGTIFLVIRLPWEPVVTQTVDLGREVFLANPGTSSPQLVQGKQQQNLAGQYNGNAVRSGFPSVPLYTIGQTQPVLFIRVKGRQIQSKTVGFDTAQSFATFFSANAYEDDPGRGLRSSYAGEVRIKNQQAHLLRMRYEEQIEGETYVFYEDFPFLSLTGFVTGAGSAAQLNAGVTFEDHIYTLEPYVSDAELAAQLAAIVNPSAYQDQPEYLPDTVIPVKVSSSFLASAANRLSTDGADELTPLTYFVAMP